MLFVVLIGSNKMLLLVSMCNDGAWVLLVYGKEQKLMERFWMTRLETRTKESNVYVNGRFWKISCYM